MSDLIRHVGKINRLGTRVIVVFRKLPDDPEHCLVIESDSLPDMYQQNLSTVILSRDAQSTTELYNVLSKNKFADGSIMLQALHEKRYLKKYPVKEVTLYPRTNVPLPLEIANQEIDGIKPDVLKETKLNEDKSDLDKAKSFLMQASYHEAECHRLRELAYQLAPELKPTSGRPAKERSEFELEIANDRKNVKRRERYLERKEKKLKQDTISRAKQKLDNKDIPQ